MSGSQGSPFTPITVGATDSGDFSSWLGRPSQIGDETYTMVQCGVAIASGSNGKQLVTALSSGSPTWVVALVTGVGEPLCCGMIPFTLVGPIASGAYFLALSRSANAAAMLLGATTGTTGGTNSGSILITTTGALLAAAITGAVTASVTGTTLDIANIANNCGIALTSQTGTPATSGVVRYRAPFSEF